MEACLRGKSCQPAEGPQVALPGGLEFLQVVLLSVSCMGTRRTRREWFWWLVVALSAAYFIARGPLRSFSQSSDFLTVYSASRGWLHGTNPYSTVDLVRTANTSGIPSAASQFEATPVLYLPPALLLFAPLALLPWPVARALWALCLVGAFSWLASRVGRLAGGMTLPLLAFLLAFAPVHTAFGRGQPSILVSALLVASATLTSATTAGVFLGLALCIKPHLSWGLLLLAVLCGERRKWFCAGTTFLFVSGLAVLPMKATALKTLAANDTAYSAASGILAGINPQPSSLSFQLLSVDTLIPGSWYGSGVVALVYTGILAVTVLCLLRSKDRNLRLAIAASATLLVGYHRFYDAQILWLCIPAFIALTRNAVFRALQGCFALFLVPGQTILANLGFASFLLFGRTSPVNLPEPLPDNALFALLLHHEAWACVFIWLAFGILSLRACHNPQESRLA